MKTILLVTSLAAMLIACGDAGHSGHTDAASSSSTGPGGSGGMGGAGGEGGQGASGGQGGNGGQGGSEPVPCSVSEDCAGVPREVCRDVQCYMGTCLDVPAPLGAQCQGQSNPSMICDGRGGCGLLMPYGADHCYEPTPLPWSECPTCDDADPTTDDVCTTGPLPQCTHSVLPEGYYCGPWYTIQDGKCCPAPETVP